MADDDDPMGASGNGSGGSIAERAANGEGSEEPEMELFPMGSIEGDAKTLKTLIRAGQDVEQTVSMGSAEVPISSGGLLDPDKEGMLLVTYEVAGYQPVPVREGDRVTGKRVKGWKLRTSLRPIHVERINGEAGAIESQFVALLDADETVAAALIDKLADRTRAKLQGGRHPARAGKTPEPVK